MTTSATAAEVKLWQNDRERLAVEMGYQRTKYNRWKSPCRKRVDSIPPDPFNHAGDDYAVLEWVRAIEEEGLDRDGFHFEFAGRLPHSYAYRVGDYARAAITVLREREQT